MIAMLSIRTHLYFVMQHLVTVVRTLLQLLHDVARFLPRLKVLKNYVKYKQPAIFARCHTTVLSHLRDDHFGSINEPLKNY